jgi:hypothetical protein
MGLEPATFRLADAWSACLPGPGPRPITERNLDSGSLAASLLQDIERALLLLVVEAMPNGVARGCR